MDCSSCGHPNPEDARFCGQCAAPLAASLVCPGCGRENPPGQKFCNGCAQPLSAAPPSTPAASRAAPLPETLGGGRYRVKRFLGEGTRKRVYLARDTRLDSDVAVAVIKMEDLDAEGLVRVRREAQAMGRLRDHPHIVAVFDIGTEGPQPYIVSQYMDGGSVADLLGATEGHRLPLERAIRIAEHVCRGLDHAHRHGIVHRDLKPGNVWLTQDGSARLGDFGLALALDRSRLTQEGALVGTVAYMAPEQAVGGGTDAHSDLYAVGAMLYEMVAGRPPFLGEDAVTVISQHINTAPVAPSWHNPEVSEALESLILRLLAKDPTERAASAGAIADELARIELAPRAPVAAAAARREPAGPRASWGRFVGRHHEMEQLKAALDGALSGRGALLMLVGEPGIGKTRLAEEFTVYAKLRGAQVLAGRSYEGSVEVPYYPFVEAFRQYVGTRDDQELRDELGDAAPDLANLVSEVRQRLPDLPQAPPIEGEADRLRLFESAASFLVNASRARPLVLLLDDLHWADKPSLLMLRYLARSLPGERLLVLGTYRDVELDRTHPLSEVLATLRREPIYQRVLLRGLPQEDVFALLSALAEDEADAESLEGRTNLAEALSRETEGNPFFIGEVLSHLVEEGKLFREGGRWRTHVDSASELGIPEGVREVVGRRLTRLSEAANKMLGLASAMPAGFTWDVIRAVSGTDEAALLDALEEALAARVLRERKDARGAVYEFHHALIRQTLYEELSAPRRVLLHRRIGEKLEALYAANPGPHLAELAHHFFEAAPGGDVGKAVDYAVRAGERAHELAAYEEAVGHYGRALQALDLRPEQDAAQHCDLLLTLADAHLNAGTSESARSVAERASGIARELGDSRRLALAALRHGLEFVGELELDRARVDALNEALAALGEADPALRARLLARLATAYVFVDGARAEAFADRALEVAREAPDPSGRAYALNAKYLTMGGPERLEERLAITDEMAEAAEAAGIHPIVTNAHWDAIFNHLEKGDAAPARRHAEAHGRLARELRTPALVWQHEVLGGLWALLEGRFEQAEEIANHALALSQRLENPFGGLAMYSIQISRIWQERGSLEQLESVLKQRIADQPHVGWRARLAHIHTELGRQEEARRELDELAEKDFADIQRDLIWLLTIGYLGEVAAFLRDRPRCELLYELLLPHADRNVVVLNAACNGSVSRQLALLAAALGHVEDAERHFEDALAMNQRLESPPLIARTQADYARVLLERDGPGDREKALQLASRALAAAQELGMQRLSERVLVTKLEAQGIRGSDTQHSIHAVAFQVQQEQPDLARHAAPDGTVTLMFSDMEGFTRMTERLGDLRAHEVVREHNRIVREQVARHGGHEVELRGDGFLMAFASARQGVQCAIALQRALSRSSGDEAIRVRIGLHTGEALRDADKFFGRTVIQAFRIADLARGGEILVSSLTRELVASAGDLQFGEPRSVELKGLAGEHAVHPVSWS
jgi:class 3 adenylate cyclase